jgi:hypothetical protein
VYQVAEDTARFVVDPYGKNPGVYEFSIPRLEIRPLIPPEQDREPQPAPDA